MFLPDVAQVAPGNAARRARVDDSDTKAMMSHAAPCMPCYACNDGFVVAVESRTAAAKTGGENDACHMT